MKIEIGKEVVVAQTDEPKHPWGVWQFPAIARQEPEVLSLSFSRTIDSGTRDTVKKINVPGSAISVDNGKSWRAAEPAEHLGERSMCLRSNGDCVHLDRPPPQDVPKDQLPAPVGVLDNGYNGFYTVRDPMEVSQEKAQWHLGRRPAGTAEWERIPVTMDDPDAGVMSFDPPDESHAVMYWRWPMEVIELPDTSLLAIFYGARLGPDRRPHPKWESYCARSADDGLTWRFHGVIARDDHHPLVGYTEPDVAVLQDGSLLAALRTECAKTGPLSLARSVDGGKAWDSPRIIHPFGVLPKLLVLENGVTVLAFGRPGVHLSFSSDGRGEEWQSLTTLVVESFSGTGVSGEGYGYQEGENPEGRPKQTRTSGYTGLVANGPDCFLIAYDQFDYPNAEGEARKTILVREIRVSSAD